MLIRDNSPVRKNYFLSHEGIYLFSILRTKQLHNFRWLKSAYDENCLLAMLSIILFQHNYDIKTLKFLFLFSIFIQVPETAVLQKVVCTSISLFNCIIMKRFATFELTPNFFDDEVSPYMQIISKFTSLSSYRTACLTAPCPSRRKTLM